MERPLKRARIGPIPRFDDSDSDEDEISMDPGHFAVRQDPGYRLEKSRARADFRLKSTFENIFDKYEKDFSDIGDEIDLRTGEIVVDNGHVRSLQDDQDEYVGQAVVDNVLSEAAAEDALEEEEEERILHGRRVDALTIPRPMPMMPPPPVGAWSQMSSKIGGGPRISSIFPPHLQFMNWPMSFGLPNDFVDPAWQTPELPVSAFRNAFLSQFGSSHSAAVRTKTVVRKALPMATGETADEEDDILLGPSATKLGRPSLPPPPADTSPKDKERNAGPLQGKTPPRTFKVPFTLQDEAIPPKEKWGKRGTKRSIGTADLNETRSVDTLAPAASGIVNPDEAPRRKGRPPFKAPHKHSKAVVVHQKPANQNVAKQVPPPRKAIVSEVGSPVLGPKRLKSPKRTLQTLGNENKQLVVVPKSGNPRNRKGSELETEDPQRRSSRSKRQIEFYSDATWADSSWQDVPSSGRRKERLVIEIVAKRPHPLSEGSTALSTASSTQPPPQQPDPQTLGPVAGSGHELEVPSPTQRTMPSSRNKSSSPPIAPSVPALPCAAQRKAAETFSRNVLDPSFNFSDEEDGLIRKRPSKPVEPAKERDSTRTLRSQSRPGSKPGSKPVSSTNGSQKKPSEAVQRDPSTHAGKDISSATGRRRLRSSGGGELAALKETEPQSEEPLFEELPSEEPPPEEPPSEEPPSEEPLSEELLSEEMLSEEPLSENPLSEHQQELRPNTSPQDKQPSTKKLTPYTRKTQTINGVPSDEKRRPHDNSLSPAMPQRESHSPLASKQKVVPVTPERGNVPKSPTSHPTPSEDSILSLLPDEDLDELSLTPRGPPSGPPSHRGTMPSARGPSSGSLPRKSTVKHSLLFSALTKPHTPSKPRAAGSGRKRHSLDGSSGRRRFSLPLRSRAPSPTGSLIRTPGGTMRRCGEDGFKCDRDFCFTCL